MSDISKITLPNNKEYNFKDKKARDDLEAITSTLEASYISTNKVTSIPANSDLNDYLTPGNYYIASSNTAATITANGNPLPYTENSTYRLTVLQGGGSGIIQILQVTGWASLAIYTRLKTGLTGTWYAWNKLVSSGMSDVSFPSLSLTGTPTAPTAAAGTSTTQIATTEFVQTTISNIISTVGVYPNLLDNWYFGTGVINQRRQDNYTLKKGQYGIDRWKCTGQSAANPSLSISFNDDSITITNTSTDLGRFESMFPDYLPKGKYTLSALVKSVTIPEGVTQPSIVCLDPGNVAISASRSYLTGSGLFSATFENPNSSTGSGQRTKRVAIIIYGGTTITLKAVKLECGNIQTLAHQENGEWVLNELPDLGMLLLKCQRYFQVFEEIELPSSPLDYRPILYQSPTFGSFQDSNGALYSYASAEL